MKKVKSKTKNRRSIDTSNSVRCAIYARAAIGEQGKPPSPVENQIRERKRHAAGKKWRVLPEFVVGEIGSGNLVNPGLGFLIAASRKRPRPFDCLLVSDLFRIARNFRVFVKVKETLDKAGVLLHSGDGQVFDESVKIEELIDKDYPVRRTR